jgi:hypothetical protein
MMNYQNNIITIINNINYWISYLISINFSMIYYEVKKKPSFHEICNLSFNGHGCFQELPSFMSLEHGRESQSVTKQGYRRTSISGTTSSGKKCLSGTSFHAIWLDFSMLFDDLQREKVSKREGYLCFFLPRLSKFSCITEICVHSQVPDKRREPLNYPD